MESSELKIYLEAGFIDYQKKQDQKYLPRLLSNSDSRRTKVLDTLIYELEKCDDFFFSVAFITNTGIAVLNDTLLRLKLRNIRGKILASQYQNFTEPRALRKLLRDFPNIELKIITQDYNFHAKGYMFHRVSQNTGASSDDDYTMIVGSSNLTQSALTVNREWNVLLSSMRDGALIRQMQGEMLEAWTYATPVTEAWLEAYEKIYTPVRTERGSSKGKIVQLYKVQPNKMQVAALKSIQELRDAGKTRALLISATGTGKTYLSAFDVRTARPRRCLFIVHRGLIARKSKASFEKIIDTQRFSTGLYTSGTKEADKDYLFATVQTLNIDANLMAFSPDTFDYIIVDEAHHAGAETYQKILRYFRPKFLLGMTATPERSDCYDIFRDFDYNIAYEIRLSEALRENMLVPFHYHGISEISPDGEPLGDASDFARLTCDERVKHILKYADFYGCDQGRVKGLVFCSKTEEAEELARAFSRNGRRAEAISATTSESERLKLIRRLESDEPENCCPLDYLFSVDVLNEGVDIPDVNQVILLRPTASAIVFVQQLGRGLRKSRNKRYLEVIDFIGNYANNYMLPIALYGDTSCNKDRLRRMLHVNYLPGASTVHFDDIAKEKIFASLNRTNFTLLRSLRESYRLVKLKLGRAPMMTDFLRLGDKDPYLFVKCKRSYYNFKTHVENERPALSSEHRQVLEFVSMEIANGRRLEEVELLLQLLKLGEIEADAFIEHMRQECDVPTSKADLVGALNVLTLKFFKEQDAARYGNIALVKACGNRIALSAKLRLLLENAEFKDYLEDALAYGRHTFLEGYRRADYYHGFKLYASYTRKDACRILNWQKDESSTIYGYRVKYATCPIFVTYKKSGDISYSTRYNDRFLSPSKFSWLTRNRVTLESTEVKAIENPTTLKLLFVKKSDDEGSEFYFLGPMTFLSKTLSSIATGQSAQLPIVNILYKMDISVEPGLLSYFESEPVSAL